MQPMDLAKLLTALSCDGLRIFTAADIPDGTAPDISTRHPFYLPHSHPQFELICLLEGELLLNINRHWRHWQAQKVLAFLPGALHGEHYLALAKSYRMLWITVCQTALLFHTTAYDAATGYTTSRKRLALTPPMCESLWQTAAHQKFPHDCQLHAKFHALLMESIIFVLENQHSRLLTAGNYHAQVIEQVKCYLHEHYWENISIHKLARLVHYSPGHLNTVFRRYEKKPLHHYLNEIRLAQARQLLANGGMLVKQVAQAVGFKDPLYFSRLFRRQFGSAPTALCRHTRQRRQPAQTAPFKRTTPAYVSKSRR